MNILTYYAFRCLIKVCGVTPSFSFIPSGSVYRLETDRFIIQSFEIYINRRYKFRTKIFDKGTNNTVTIHRDQAKKIYNLQEQMRKKAFKVDKTR